MAQRSAASARNTSPEISAPRELWRYPEQFANVPQRSSFVPQRHHRIDSRGPPRREETRGEACRHYNGHDCRKYPWVSGRNTRNLADQKAREYIACQETSQNPERNQTETVEEHEAQNT